MIINGGWNGATIFPTIGVIRLYLKFIWTGVWLCPWRIKNTLEFFVFWGRPQAPFVTFLCLTQLEAMKEKQMTWFTKFLNKFVKTESKAWRYRLIRLVEGHWKDRLGSGVGPWFLKDIPIGLPITGPWSLCLSDCFFFFFLASRHTIVRRERKERKVPFFSFFLSMNWSLSKASITLWLWLVVVVSWLDGRREIWTCCGWIRNPLITICDV